VIRRVQFLLFLIAAVTGLWVAYGTVRAAVYREVQTERIERVTRVETAAIAASKDSAAATGKDPKADAALARDGVVGVLEIPRLKLSEVVASGDDDKTLDLAIGHLRDTPLPWTSGNSVLAAHRDTHFRPLRHIRQGDLIRLKTRQGVLEYSVKDTMIVAPKDVWVMAPTTGRRLTLVTCYPFNYVGSAPQRFIVIADAR
jgi:sortase A